MRSNPKAKVGPSGEERGVEGAREIPSCGWLFRASLPGYLPMEMSNTHFFFFCCVRASLQYPPPPFPFFLSFCIAPVVCFQLGVPIGH